MTKNYDIEIDFIIDFLQKRSGTFNFDHSMVDRFTVDH